MFKRRKMGHTYDKAPFQNVADGISNNVSKLVFWILYSAIYLAALYIVTGVFVFLGTYFSNMWEEGTPTLSVFNSPYCLPLKVIGVVCVFIYVFRDNLTKR
jgi:hypothetical protein